MCITSFSSSCRIAWVICEERRHIRLGPLGLSIATGSQSCAPNSANICPLCHVTTTPKGIQHLRLDSHPDPGRVNPIPIMSATGTNGDVLHNALADSNVGKHVRTNLEPPFLVILHHCEQLCDMLVASSLLWCGQRATVG